MRIIQVTAFLLGTALAQDSSSGSNPANGGNNLGIGGMAGSTPLCPAGLYSQAQCCGTDALGVLDTECKNPSSSPSNLAEFKKDCEKSGKSAKCCVLPIANQDVLCSDAV